ncbi:MAG: hypothetical protein QM758_18615 [Armatimonas sp.]
MTSLSIADDEFVELLVASAPRISDFQFSDSVKARFWELVHRKKDNSLTLEEEAELERYNYLEHLVRMAKAKYWQVR